MKKINKTLQQKWYDFTHPTKIEHYGYHFSSEDMRQFPEGRIILCDIKRIKLQQKRNQKIDKIIQGLGRAFNSKMDELILDCMSNN